MYDVFLACLVDQQPHDNKEMRRFIAERLGVTEKEQQALLPSGRQTVFHNRVGWTGTYLLKAGLVERPARATYQITELGKQVMDSAPAHIDNDFLDRFEQFREFRSANNAQSAPPQQIGCGNSPQDALDLSFRQINDALADEVLAEVMKQSPEFFESLVVKLLESMGYGGSVENAGTVVGKSGDEGIDGIIKEDKLGFNLIYIQAKRWDRDKSIGRPEIQRFVGALAGQGANKGLFITTAQFTKEAREYAQKQHTTKVVLVDGQSLARHMIDNNLGVSTETVYQIKRLDTDFFGEN